MTRQTNDRNDTARNVERPQLPQAPQQYHQQQHNDHDIPPITLTHGHAYISVEGSYINAIGSQNYGVPSHYVQNRIARDGGNHSHLTLIHPKELKVAIANANIVFPKKHKSRAIKALIQWIIERVGHPSTWHPNDWPVDLGMAYSKKVEEEIVEGGGTSSSSKHTVSSSSKAYYRVLHWPLGERIRQLLQLGPAFFHVTVGFNPKDVHGLYKGPGTLLSLDSCSSPHHYHHGVTRDGDDEVLVKELANLVKVSCHYTKDIVFLNALANRCLFYHEKLDACAVDWRFILQYSNSSQSPEGDEIWYDAPEAPESPISSQGLAIY